MTDLSTHHHDGDTPPAPRPLAPHALRTWGLGRATQVLAAARLAQLRRHAQIGSGVRVDLSATIRGNVGALVIGDHAHVSRGVRLSLENPHGVLHIGSHTKIHDFSILRTQQGSVNIGSHVSIHPFGLVSGDGGVVIGDNTRIGPKLTILSSTHLYADPDVLIRHQGTEPRQVTIGEDVWIGAGVTILGEVTIGRGAVVGAGAVVNQDVEPFAVVAGVPARRIGTRGD